MERKKLRTEITHLINKIKEHSDNLTGKENIPQLELEMILHKIEKLYELSIVFNYLSKLNEARTIDFEEEEEHNKAMPETLTSETEGLRISTLVIGAKEKEKEAITIPTDLFGETLIAKEEKKEDKKEEKKHNLLTQKPSIANLKSAIGINEKFQFLNQLFSGNVLEYDTAIHQLNSSETLDSARVYLEGLIGLYNWNKEDETFKYLLELVERRFS